MQVIVTLLFILSVASTACASDSISLGVRGGAAAGRSSYFTEAFGDLYLNRLISVGATAGYFLIDNNKNLSAKRDASVPVTALFKIHVPTPIISPYAGLGEALVFHDKRRVNGTPVALAGINLGLGPTPIFLNIEYRRQFDDKLDFLSGGIGVGF